MAKENEGQSIRDYGNRKKRIKRRRNIIIVVSILILAVVGAIYLYSLYNKNYKSFEVLSSVDNTVENGEQYLSYGSSVVKYSKDGATAINKDGELLWNGSYEMNNPIADTCGKFVVIADKGGNSIQIFDDKGAAGSITTLNDIVKVEIASQGVVVALMEAEESNYATLYDVDGTVLVEMATNVIDDGYPVDISLSEDGKKLITNYLSITGGELTGIATFYNFGEVGQNWTEGIVGALKFEGIVVPRTVFNNNSSACIFKENGFMILAYSELPKLVKEETFENKIDSILHNDKYIGVVLEGGEATYRQLLLYDLEGNKVLDKKIDFDYSDIYLTGEEIIMHDNSSCIVMKLNGKVKFSFTFDSNIDAFYPINDLDRYLLVDDNKISEIALVE